RVRIPPEFDKTSSCVLLGFEFTAPSSPCPACRLSLSRGNCWQDRTCSRKYTSRCEDLLSDHSLSDAKRSGDDGWRHCPISREGGWGHSRNSRTKVFSLCNSSCSEPSNIRRPSPSIRNVVCGFVSPLGRGTIRPAAGSKRLVQSIKASCRRWVTSSEGVRYTSRCFPISSMMV